MAMLMRLGVALGALVAVGIGLQVVGAARSAELVRPHAGVLESGRVGD